MTGRQPLVRSQGAGVVATKRIRGDNDVKDHVAIPRDVIAEVARVCTEAPGGALDALRQVGELLKPWSS